jgi:hypothetical protein
VNALAAKLLASDLEASLRFIFDLDDGAPEVVRRDNVGRQVVDYEAISRHLAGVAASQAEAGDEDGGADGGGTASGRLGPPHVVVSEARGSAAIESGVDVLSRQALSAGDRFGLLGGYPHGAYVLKQLTQAEAWV